MLRRIIHAVLLLVTVVVVSPAWARIETFGTIEFPWGLAFDGTDLWVSSPYSYKVGRLRASDGSPDGIFDAGGEGRSLAFDGQNIWIAHLTVNNITVLRASDGSMVANYPIITFAVLFDGTSIWAGGVSASGYGLLKIRPNDGTVLLHAAIDPTVYGLTSDGENIWATQYYHGTVIKVRASDGAILGTFAVGKSPWGAAFDGANVWVANTSDGTVTKLRASDGSILGNFPIATADLACDGKHLWAPDFGSAVRRVRLRDGAVDHVYQVGPLPSGILYDGSSIWVSDLNSHAVTKISPP